MSVENAKSIPLLDLISQFKPYKEEIFSSWEKLFAQGSFVLGKEVETFEKEIAEYLQVKYALGVTSGTDAIFIALKALDLKPGDKVLTTPFTFFGTISAICNAGLTPIFCDIDEKTFNLSHLEVEKLLRTDPSIKAILPVHLYGMPCEMNALSDLAKKYNLKLMEDSAQAIGTTFQGKKVGSFGDFGTFSFYPTKNLGALGDAGLITTQDQKLYETIKLLRNRGSKITYHHERIGGNFRIDALQAAALRVFLPQLPNWIEKRRRLAKNYQEALSSLSEKIALPELLDSHTYHQYTLRVLNGKREALQNYLKEKEIASAIYYPIPCHLQKALSHLGHKPGMFPKTEKASQEVLSLPIYTTLSDSDQHRIIESIQQFFKL